MRAWKMYSLNSRADTWPKRTKKRLLNNSHIRMATSLDTNDRRYWPLGQLIVSRIREFVREPEALFWVYGFPIVMTIALGIAFRNQPIEKISVDVVENPQGPATRDALASAEGPQRFKAEIFPETEASRRLRTGKTDVIVVATAGAESAPHYEYRFDRTRPQSVLARSAVDDQLQRAAGRGDVAKIDS